MPNLDGESPASDAESERRRQTQRTEAFGQVAGGIAHEFNNLLMVILGNLDLCETAARTPAERKRFIAEARGAAERCAAVTRQLDMIGHRRPVDAQVLDLNVAVEQSLSALRGSLAQATVLVSNLAPAPSPVRADPGGIHRILNNLIANAVEAMPHGGSLVITTEDDFNLGETSLGPSPDRYVRLSVRDTGDGMSQETRQRALEPFFTTRIPSRGRGLGLATTDALVAQMSGSITISSQPGAGTEVVVLLPRATEPIGTPALEHDQTVMKRSR